MWAAAAAAGLLLILLALLAYPLGLDNDPGWGAGRLALLIAGLAVTGGALLGRAASRRLSPRARQALAARLGTLLRSERVGLGAAALVFAGLAAFALWFGSSGLFPAFPRIGSLYPLQGEAFLRGRLTLLEEPPAALAQLEDPYEPSQRAGIPYLWDASYYQGKYYLYWGPVPALAFAALSGVAGALPPDQSVALLAALGFEAVLLALLWRIRRLAFPRAPGLSVALFGFAGLMNLPMLFLLVRPHQYETSILAGLAFLLLGLLGWWKWMETARPGWLALAGAGWGLAVGCRYNLALSAGVFSLAALLHAWRCRRIRGPFWRQILPLAIPLALCAAGLALYNLARFGHPLQTGLAYQLTVAVPAEGYLSGRYLLPNLYRYLLYPYRPAGVFPVIQAVPPGAGPGWAAGFTGLPYDLAIFGMLATLPEVWLAVLWPLALAGERGGPAAREHPGGSGTRPELEIRAVNFKFRLLAGALAAAGLLQFGFLLFYYYYAVRFWADFYPLALLLTALAAWALDRRLAGRPALRVLLWAAVTAACLWSAFLGFFGAFSAPPEMFEVYNPGAAAAIEAGWNRLYQDPGLSGAALRLLVRLLTAGAGI